MLDDNKVYVIKWSDSKKSFYDVATGLLTATETTGEVQGQKVSSMIKYDNYKEVKGVKFPMTLIQGMAGRDMRFDINTMRVNEGVTEADFE